MLERVFDIDMHSCPSCTHALQTIAAIALRQKPALRRRCARMHFAPAVHVVIDLCGAAKHARIDEEDERGSLEVARCEFDTADQLPSYLEPQRRDHCGTETRERGGLATEITGRRDQRGSGQRSAVNSAQHWRRLRSGRRTGTNVPIAMPNRTPTCLLSARDRLRGQCRERQGRQERQPTSASVEAFCLAHAPKHLAFLRGRQRREFRKELGSSQGANTFASPRSDSLGASRLAQDFFQFARAEGSDVHWPRASR
jgi:hypothetical protein